MKIANRLIAVPVSVVNQAASGPIGTAALTVDVACGAILAQTTAGITLSIPTPTVVEEGQRFFILNAGTAAVIVGGMSLSAGSFVDFVYNAGAWSTYSGAIQAGWNLNGNAATAPSNIGTTVGDYLGTKDNKTFTIKTRGASAAAQSLFQVLWNNGIGATGPVATADVMRILRAGTAGVKNNASAGFGLGTWGAGINARTRFDIRLGQTSVNPEFGIITAFSLGAIAIGQTTPANPIWAANATGDAIGRGGVGNAKLCLDGLNGSLGGPHVQYTTTVDNFPLRQDLNFGHNNINIAFDGYYNGAWRAAHTSRPYGIYKLSDALQISGAAAVPVAAGNVWTVDAAFFFRYQGSGAAAGTAAMELGASNVTANRRIVLYSGGANDHQYYGFGVNNSTLRYQIDSTASRHVFYSALTTTTSQEVMRITGTGFVGIGVVSPTYRLDVDNTGAALNTPVASLMRFEGDTTYRIGALKGVTTNNNGDVVGKFGLYNTAGAPSTPDAMLVFRRGATPTDGSLAFSTGGDVERMRINSGGLVMIGTTTPTAGMVLTVQGDAAKTGGGTWAVTSSKKFKKNIRSFKRGLEEVIRLRPVTFDRKDGSSKGEIGIILEEARLAIPEIALSDDLSDGGNSVIYALVNAIKTLTAKLEVLEHKAATA